MITENMFNTYLGFTVPPQAQTFSRVYLHFYASFRCINDNCFNYFYPPVVVSIDVRPVIQPWSESTLTFNNRPDYENTYDTTEYEFDQVSSVNNKFYPITIELTDILLDYLVGNDFSVRVSSEQHEPDNILILKDPPPTLYFSYNSEEPVTPTTPIDYSHVEKEVYFDLGEDPLIVTYYAMEDAYIDSASPDQSFSHPENVKSGANGQYYTYVSFDLTGADNGWSKAYLEGNFVSGIGSNEEWTCQINNLASSFSASTLTYNNRPGINPSAAVYGEPFTSNGNYEYNQIEINDVAQAWRVYTEQKVYLRVYCWTMLPNDYMLISAAKKGPGFSWKLKLDYNNYNPIIPAFVPADNLMIPPTMDTWLSSHVNPAPPPSDDPGKRVVRKEVVTVKRVHKRDCTECTLSHGFDDILKVSAKDTERNYALYSFSLTGIPDDAIIDSATFYTMPRQQVGNPSTIDVYMLPNFIAFDDSSTGENYPLLDITDAASYISSEQQVDVKSKVDLQRDISETKIQFLLRPGMDFGGTLTSGYDYYSLENVDGNAFLGINYHVPTTMATPTPTPSARPAEKYSASKASYTSSLSSYTSYVWGPVTNYLYINNDQFKTFLSFDLTSVTEAPSTTLHFQAVYRCDPTLGATCDFDPVGVKFRIFDTQTDFFPNTLSYANDPTRGIFTSSFDFIADDVGMPQRDKIDNEYITVAIPNLSSTIHDILTSGGTAFTFVLQGVNLPNGHAVEIIKNTIKLTFDYGTNEPLPNDSLFQVGKQELQFADTDNGIIYPSVDTYTDTSSASTPRGSEELALVGPGKTALVAFDYSDAGTVFGYNVHLEIGLHAVSASGFDTTCTVSRLQDGFTFSESTTASTSLDLHPGTVQFILDFGGVGNHKYARAFVDVTDMVHGIAYYLTNVYFTITCDYGGTIDMTTRAFGSRYSWNLRFSLPDAPPPPADTPTPSPTPSDAQTTTHSPTVAPTTTHTPTTTISPTSAPVATAPLQDVFTFQNSGDLIWDVQTFLFAGASGRFITLASFDITPPPGKTSVSAAYLQLQAMFITQNSDFSPINGETVTFTISQTLQGWGGYPLYGDVTPISGQSTTDTHHFVWDGSGASGTFVNVNLDITNFINTYFYSESAYNMGIQIEADTGGYDTIVIRRTSPTYQPTLYLSFEPSVTDPVDFVASPPTLDLGLDQAILDFADHSNRILRWPKQDAYVDSSNPNTHVETTDGYFPVGNGGRYFAYVDFDITGIPSVYGSAVLDVPARSTVSGNFICQITLVGPWDAGTITYNNRPSTIAFTSFNIHYVGNALTGVDISTLLEEARLNPTQHTLQLRMSCSGPTSGDKVDVLSKSMGPPFSWRLNVFLPTLSPTATPSLTPTPTPSGDRRAIARKLEQVAPQPTIAVPITTCRKVRNESIALTDYNLMLTSIQMVVNQSPLQFAHVAVAVVSVALTGGMMALFNLAAIVKSFNFRGVDALILPAALALVGYVRRKADFKKLPVIGKFFNKKKNLPIIASPYTAELRGIPHTMLSSRLLMDMLVPMVSNATDIVKVTIVYNMNKISEFYRKYEEAESAFDHYELVERHLREAGDETKVKDTIWFSRYKGKFHFKREVEAVEYYSQQVTR